MRVQHTGNIAAPDSSVMATVSTQALSVVRVPHSGSMILGTREQKVPISVVLEKGQRPLMALQQDGPHRVLPFLFADPCFPRSHARASTRAENKEPLFSNTGGEKNQVLITTHCCFPHFLNWVREERDEDFTSGEAEQRQKTAGGTRAERSATKLPQTLHTRVVCPKSKLRTLGFQHLERQSR